MTVDPAHILKAKAKSYYKVRGVLITHRMVNDTLMEFIIRKGSGKKEVFFALKTFNDAVIRTITNSPHKTRFAIKFKVESKEWQGRWYTTLWAHEIEEWKVGADIEARIKRNEAIQAAADKNVQEKIESKNSNLNLFGSEGWG
jgi:hypothetical protein